ncbi:3-phosphoserine/phosphohydroxythreonine transaminase [Amphibacillus sp. MSJ-3]|uniref:3-phosphoserine/phosphohydroxythreonine transaminase n=1 Tax=Amphibacillus sp. MSJ-3 TaxID=2841505 RepID=UPI001C0EB14E|nr:3-phosphoserine/phosphohydroxythreonine transaminase [Amphibacillus sp. MSJ-3]MBU5593741.1 3-phosphoserine/phosphohydroxythreonine transaminase [Amphibacillus sp. MSJ-3]
MSKVYNFSAGPAILPKSVLEKAQAELLDFNGSGMSVMELSHRSNWFMTILEEAESGIRKLMNIPDNYKVLFLQGGASQQFAMVPMNLLVNNKQADYVLTGSWSKKAYKEAKAFGEIQVVGEDTINHIPSLTKEMFNPKADYVHITTNNTIEGTAFSELPDTGDIPLVADMSSNILSTPIDVSKFGIIYAGAQKNIGPAGLTIVIIRDDLIGLASGSIPTIFDYKTHAENNSVFNTPPTFSIYVAKLVFDWLQELGGLEVIEKINREKADLLYGALDQSNMFEAPIKGRDRSLMNVPFIAANGDKELEAKFINEAKENGLETLKGHRSVGGMRASIYNAMPLEGVKALVDFIKEFERKNS